MFLMPCQEVLNQKIIEEKIKLNMEKNKPLEICLAVGGELKRLPYNKDVVECLTLFCESKLLNNSIYFSLHCDDASTSVERLDIDMLHYLNSNNRLLSLVRKLEHS